MRFPGHMRPEKAGFKPTPNKDKKRDCSLCLFFREAPTSSSCVVVWGDGGKRGYTCTQFLPAKGHSMQDLTFEDRA